MNNIATMFQELATETKSIWIEHCAFICDAKRDSRWSDNEDFQRGYNQACDELAAKIRKLKAKEAA